MRSQGPRQVHQQREQDGQGWKSSKEGSGCWQDSDRDLRFWIQCEDVPGKPPSARGKCWRCLRLADPVEGCSLFQPGRKTESNLAILWTEGQRQHDHGSGVGAGWSSRSLPTLSWTCDSMNTALRAMKAAMGIPPLSLPPCRPPGPVPALAVSPGGSRGRPHREPPPPGARPGSALRRRRSAAGPPGHGALREAGQGRGGLVRRRLQVPQQGHGADCGHQEVPGVRGGPGDPEDRPEGDPHAQGGTDPAAMASPEGAAGTVVRGQGVSTSMKGHRCEDSSEGTECLEGTGRREGVRAAMKRRDVRASLRCWGVVRGAARSAMKCPAQSVPRGKSRCRGMSEPPVQGWRCRGTLPSPAGAGGS